jgi:hypothetical protein
MVYYIKLDQGDYFEFRGGNDWGRTSKSHATRFDDRKEAHHWAKIVGGKVCREID